MDQDNTSSIDWSSMPKLIDEYKMLRNDLIYKNDDNNDYVNIPVGVMNSVLLNSQSSNLDHDEYYNNPDSDKIVSILSTDIKDLINELSLKLIDNPDNSDKSNDPVVITKADKIRELSNENKKHDQLNSIINSLKSIEYLIESYKDSSIVNHKSLLKSLKSLSLTDGSSNSSSGGVIDDLLDGDYDNDDKKDKNKKRSRKGRRSKLSKLESPLKSAKSVPTTKVPTTKTSSPKMTAPSTTSKIASGASKTLGVGSKALGAAGAALAVADGVYQYSNAESEEEREDIVGDTGGMLVGALAGGKAGAALGASVGAVFGGVGAVPGALIGGVIGSVAGGIAGSSIGKGIASWFHDPWDQIPDEVKDKGTIAEIKYIDKVLYPSMITDMQSGNSKWDEEDLKDLDEYKNKLIKEKLPKELGQNPIITNKDSSSIERFNLVKDFYSSLKDDDPELYLEVLNNLPKDLYPTHLIDNEKESIKLASSTKMPMVLNSVNPYSGYMRFSGANQSVQMGNANISHTTLANSSFSNLTPSTNTNKIADINKLGSLSEQYESGGRGVATISKGGSHDPDGGVSYGRYQLASNTGTMASFLKNEGSKWSDKFKGLIPGSKEFNDVYKQVVRDHGNEFDKAQHDYIQRTHYSPITKIAKSLGYDVDNPVIQQVLWSQSVQHSPEGNRIILKNALKDITDLKDTKSVVKSIYNSRTNYTNSLKKADWEKKSLANRYTKEAKDALAMVESMNTTDAITSPNSSDPINSGMMLAQDTENPQNLSNTSSSSIINSDEYSLPVKEKSLLATTTSTKLSTSTNQNNNNPIIINQSSSVQSDPFRLSDNSLLINSAII